MSEWELPHGTRELMLLITPAAGLVLYFLGGFALYLARTGLHGTKDREMRERGSSLILGPFVRDYFAWLMSPLLRTILASGLPANMVTVLSLILASASGLAVGLGHFALGGWLFLGSGFCDFLDGRVARMTRQSSKSGALLDSVFDRYAEGVLFVGLAWFYRESWVLLVVMAAAVGSQLVSYVRSRCGDLGVDVGRVGLLQRPERVAILGSTICLSPILEYLIRPDAAQPAYHLAVTGVAFVAVMSNVTAFQRLHSGMKQLSGGAGHDASKSQQLRPNPHTTR